MGSDIISNISDFMPVYGIMAIVIGAPLLYMLYRSVTEKAFMQKMAGAFRFSYEREGDIGTVIAKTLDHQGSMFDILSGNYAGTPIRIFTYRIYVGGREGYWSYQTVFEMQCGATLPDIILHPSGLSLNAASEMGFSSISSASWLLDTYEKISLEGDFNKYFTLYAAKGSHIETLEIFAPDTMVLMIDTYRSFGLEFIQNKIYMYPRKLIKTEKEFRDTLALAEHMYSHLAPTLEGMRLSNAQSPTPPNV